MAKIRGRKSKQASSGGYGRLFGDEQLGILLSKVHGTVISAGSELERIIAKKVAKIDDLDEFLKKEIMDEGVFLATKKQMRNCSTFGKLKSEPDFIIFKRRKGRQACHVVELKDGHVFDTKKASAEHEMLKTFAEKNGPRLAYTVQIHVVCFNQGSRKAIVEGFRNRISIKEAMTGKEFCDLLEIDYAKIVNMRKKDQKDNLSYFAEELASIASVSRLLLADKRLKK